MKPLIAPALAAALAATAALAAGAAFAPAAVAQEGPGDVMGGFRGKLDVVAIDTDDSGTLTRAELQARAVERLARADTNGDGNLDRLELVAAMPVAPHAFLEVFAEDPSERRADRLIALMGGTESGQIPVAALAERRVNALLAMADTDRDAVLSVVEIEAVGERMDRQRPPRGGRGHEHDGPRGPREEDARG